MSRSFGSPSQHASRSGLSCLSLLHASASYCPTQFPKVLPPAQSDQLRWANEVCHEMFEDTVFSTFSGGSATFGLILLSGDDAPRGESFCGRSIPMALLTLLQICLQGSPSAALSEMMCSQCAPEKGRLDDLVSGCSCCSWVFDSDPVNPVFWNPLATHPAPSTTPFLQIKAWERRALSGFILCCDLAGVADLKTGTMIVEP